MLHATCDITVCMASTEYTLESGGGAYTSNLGVVYPSKLKRKKSPFQTLFKAKKWTFLVAFEQSAR